MWAKGMTVAYVRGVEAAKKDLECDEDRLETMAMDESFEGCFRQGYGHVMAAWRSGLMADCGRRGVAVC
jgi:hypothetical protein